MTLALALAAGCGGGDDDPAGGDGTEGGGGGGGVPAPSQEEADAALEFAQCMRDHGVDMPDPEISDEGVGIGMPDPSEMGVTADELQAAEEECRPILDEATPEREPLDPDELAERRDQAVALAQCMRDRGWDMPDPEISDEGGIGIENPPDVGGPGDPRFEEFEQDMAECDEESGLGGPGEGETNVDEESGTGGGTA